MISRAEATETRRRHAPRAVLTLSSGTALHQSDEGIADDFDLPDVQVGLTVGPHRFHLYIPATLMEAKVRELGDEVMPDALPDDLAALLLEAVLRDDLDRLKALCGRDIAIESIHRGVAPNASATTCLAAEQNGHRWLIRIEAPDDRGSLETLMHRWPHAPRSMSRFPLPAVLRLGTTWLPQGALASLRRGDVVLMQFMDAQGARLVIVEGLLAAAKKDQESWVLTEVPRLAQHPEKREWTMQHDTEVAAPERSATDIEQLPMQLTFDIGQVSVTLGELRSLGVGAVIELKRDVQELVRISAHGALIGQGELVDVDGRTGVRIVRLFDHG